MKHRSVVAPGIGNMKRDNRMDKKLSLFVYECLSELILST